MVISRVQTGNGAEIPQSKDTKPMIHVLLQCDAHMRDLTVAVINAHIISSKGSSFSTIDLLAVCLMGIAKGDG